MQNEAVKPLPPAIKRAVDASIAAWAEGMACGTVLDGPHPRVFVDGHVCINGAQRGVRLTFEMFAEGAEPAATLDDLCSAVDFSLTHAQNWLSGFTPGSETLAVPVAEVEAVLATCSATLAGGV